MPVLDIVSKHINLFRQVYCFYLSSVVRGFEEANTIHIMNNYNLTRNNLQSGLVKVKTKQQMP